MQFLIPDKYKDAAGVYIIRNSLNDKVYVGSAQAFKKRYLAHLSALRRGKHNSIRLQDFTQQHGLEVLRFELLHLVLPGEELGLLERQWIAATNATMPACGFNIQETPTQRLVEYPEERIEVNFSADGLAKLRHLAKARGLSPEKLIQKLVVEEARRQVIVVDKQGSKKPSRRTSIEPEKVAEIEAGLADDLSLKQIARSTSIPRSTVRRYAAHLRGPVENDRESVLARRQAGMEHARSMGTHMGRPAGKDQANLATVQSCISAGMSINETAAATGIGRSSIVRYRKHLKDAESRLQGQKGRPSTQSI